MPILRTILLSLILIKPRIAGTGVFCRRLPRQYRAFTRHMISV